MEEEKHPLVPPEKRKGMLEKRRKGRHLGRLRESEDITHTEEEVSSDVNAGGRGAIPTH
jgi:hypothetical protein